MPFSSRNRHNAKGDPGRHRELDSAPNSADDPELTDYLAALAPESELETTSTGRRFGEAQVYQLRIGLLDNEQLKAIATRRNTSPQALAQEWVLERLGWESQT